MAFGMMVPSLLDTLRRRIEELERKVADLTRQNEQLRVALGRAPPDG